MTIWNVALPVVELIEADSAEEAISDLHRRLTAAGFEVYEGALPDGANAFESRE